MVVHENSVQWAVLRLLEKWGRLPLSDVEGLLHPFVRPRFRRETIESLEAEGLITIQIVGDEEVLELAPPGRARVSGRPAPVLPETEV